MKRLAMFMLFVGAILLYGCGGAGNDGNQVVYNEIETLGEGVTLSIALPKGSYRLEMTSDSYGVDVTWIGGDCEDKSEVRIYEDSCRMTMAGQLKLHNPTTWGLGPSEIVTVKITKL